MGFGCFPAGCYLMNNIEKCIRRIVPQPKQKEFTICAAACFCIIAYRHFQRKRAKRMEEQGIKLKIKNIREHLMALVVKEAAFCSLDSGADKEVPIGALSSDTEVEQLKKTIEELEEGIDQKLALTSELAMNIQPFLDEIEKDGELMKEIEDGDTFELLLLFGKYLEEKEPVLGRRIKEGESLYNIILEANRVLKEENLEFDKLVKTLSEEKLNTSSQETRESRRKQEEKQEKVNKQQEITTTNYSTAQQSSNESNENQVQLFVKVHKDNENTVQPFDVVYMNKTQALFFIGAGDGNSNNPQRSMENQNKRCCCLCHLVNQYDDTDDIYTEDLFSDDYAIYGEPITQRLLQIPNYQYSFYCQEEPAITKPPVPRQKIHSSFGCGEINEEPVIDIPITLKPEICDSSCLYCHEDSDNETEMKEPILPNVLNCTCCSFYSQQDTDEITEH